MTENTDPLATYRARYEQLCARRDEANAKAAPLMAQLEAANARAQEAQNEANALAAKIQEIRGGEAWIPLKKEIGILAKTLSRPG